MNGFFDNNEGDQFRYTINSSPYFTNSYNNNNNNIMNSSFANLSPTSSESEKKSLIRYTSQNNMNSFTLPPTSRMIIRYDNKSESENELYTSQNMILLKSAIKNSMAKKGGRKALLAERMIIKAKRTSKRECFNRRVNFKTQPSRLSVMSDARDNIPVVTIMYSAS
ncbi:hypothetical protein QL285_011640 [Trifolium repens]|nr:hypothetical protein QL285_011640 [Trifolium repens]